MDIEDKTLLVTGANRGIGRALVQEALSRGARRVYAGTRRPFAHPDGRVTPVTLDVTDVAQVRAASAAIGALDVLINNAGIFGFDDLGERAALDEHLAVNLFGTYEMTKAVLPQLIAAGGAVVNNVSLMALAPLPASPAYSVSKAAALSLTQAQRALLAGSGVRVHAILTGPTDTEMTKALEIPKADPADVARAILDGLEKGEEDIFPDAMSRQLADGWHGGVNKALERQLAG